MGSQSHKIKLTVEGKANMERMSRDVKTSMDRVSSSIKSAYGSLAALAAVSGLAILTKQAIDSADEISKLSDRIGASTEALSQYRHVAELSGVEFNTLTKSWQFMTNQISDATTGIGDGRKALDELNLSADRLNKLRPEDQFEAIAEKLKGVKNSSDKTRLAMDLFGGRGTALLQVIANGTDGIAAMREEADRLGLTLSREDALGAAEANDAMTRLGASSKSLGLTMARIVGPSLADAANWLSVNIPQATRSAIETFREFEIGALSLASSIASALGKDLLADSLEQTMNERIDAIINVSSGKIQKFISSAQEGMIVVGSGGSGGKNSVAMDAQSAAAFDRLQNQLMSEENRIAESYINRQFIIEDAFQLGYVQDAERNQLLEQLEAEHQQKLNELTQKGLTQRQKFQQMSGAMQVKMVVGDLLAMTQGIAQHNRKAFEINKAAGIANAVISTAAGVTKALEAYPPPVSFAMAALQFAAGKVQIDAIRNASFNGGGSGTAPSTAGSVQTQTIEPIQPYRQDAAPVGTSITINLTGTAIGDDSVRALIIDAVEEAQANDEIRILTDG